MLTPAHVGFLHVTLSTSSCFSSSAASRGRRARAHYGRTGFATARMSFLREGAAGALAASVCTSVDERHAAGLMPPHKLESIARRRNAITVSNISSCQKPAIGFVGIGKTGSLFMQSVLELWAHEQLLPSMNHTRSSQPCAVGARMGWHHASAILWRQAFGRAWDDAFTFAIVRNPWARLVSHWAFHLVSKNPLDGGHLTREQRLAAQADENVSIGYFRAWVRHAARTHPPRAPDSWRFTTSDGHGNEHSRGFNASQLSWVVDEHGAQLVSAIYRLEDLEIKWGSLQRQVCGLWNLTYRAARNHPFVQAMDHPSKHAPIERYYDGETSRIVADFMAPDIGRFGYKAPGPASFTV